MGAFRAILTRVGQVRPALTAVLEHAMPLELGPSRVTLLFESRDGQSFLAAQATEPEALAILTEAARDHFGAQTVVEVKSGLRPSGLHAPTLAALDAETRRASSDRARLAVEKHPLVAAAVRLFGAELREVRLPQGEE
jgi:hypothetical protein